MFVKNFFNMFVILSISILVIFFISIYNFFPEVLYSVSEYVTFSKEGIKQKKLKVGGNSLSYIEHGEGKTVLFVHGFQSGKSIWLDYIKRLSSDYHVVAFDLPAHGNSSYLKGQSFDIETLVECLDSFVEKKGFSKFFLVGTSLGGAIVASYAAKYPKKVCKLVLLNPVGIKPDEDRLNIIKEHNEILFFPESLEDLDDLYVYLMGRRSSNSLFYKVYVLKYLERKKGIFKKIFYHFTNGDGIEKELLNIKSDTLLIMGGLDRIANSEDFDIYNKKIKNCSSLLMKDSHHIFCGDEIADITKKMDNFFKR